MAHLNTRYILSKKCDSLYILSPILTIIISGGRGTSLFKRTDFDQWEPMVSVAFNVCQEIVHKSQQSLFYTVHLKSDESRVPLIKQLHEASVQTILISHPSEMNRVVISDHRKNMIFIFEDIDELINFIFYTVAKDPLFGSDQNVESRPKNHENKLIEDLPQYCIKIDERLLRVNEEKRCDGHVNMTSEELRPGSILSDHVFNETRGFYGNKVWNAKNYLVLILKNFAQICPNQRHGPPRLSCQKWMNKTMNNHTFPCGYYRLSDILL